MEHLTSFYEYPRISQNLDVSKRMKNYVRLPIESQDIVSRLTHPSPSRRPEGTVISIHFCIPVQPDPNIIYLI